MSYDILHIIMMVMISIGVSRSLISALDVCSFNCLDMYLSNSVIIPRLRLVLYLNRPICVILDLKPPRTGFTKIFTSEAIISSQNPML